MAITCCPHSHCPNSEMSVIQVARDTCICDKYARAHPWSTVLFQALYVYYLSKFSQPLHVIIVIISHLLCACSKSLMYID